MKIARIEAQNFLGVRAVDVAAAKTIQIFAGDNFSGKSSLQEAVRMALTGESVRVEHKKDYPQLVTDDQQSGFAAVKWDGGDASIVLPSGDHNLTGSISPALPYVLDAQRFARLPENDRRSFLFGLMDLSAGGTEVKKRLLDRGCDPAKVEAAMPLLRAGFDAAHKEAQTKAREAKAAWRVITGETYGAVKAASFKVAKPEVDTKALDQLQEALATVEADIETKTNTLGDLQGRARRAEQQRGQLADLRDKAGRYARIQDKLHKDEAELKTWEEKVADTRAKASGAPAEQPLTCPHCAGLVVHRPNIVGGELQAYEQPTPARDPEAAAKLPEYHKALALLHSSVTNGKRDLAAADAAGKALDELEKAGLAEAPDADEITGLTASIDALKTSKKSYHASLSELQDQQRKATVADQKTQQAGQHHADVAAWDKIAEALSPSGIPGEMLTEALDPINDRLSQSALDSEWSRVGIESDMSITAGARDYNLLSESEKWRTDAMIAEAISHLSGIKILVLDRVDVLDLTGRADLIEWLNVMAENGELDTALLFATLKSQPGASPSCDTWWIKNGVIGQMAEAA